MEDLFTFSFLFFVSVVNKDISKDLMVLGRCGERRGRRDETKCNVAGALSSIQGELQDTLEGVENGHLAFAGGGIGADFDFVGGGDGGGGLFYVRHFDLLILMLNVLEE